jgi:hypothetical protein
MGLFEDHVVVHGGHREELSRAALMATWGEIKQAIEEAGVKDTDEVRWIDIVGLPDAIERFKDAYPPDPSEEWIVS